MQKREVRKRAILGWRGIYNLHTGESSIKSDGRIQLGRGPYSFERGEWLEAQCYPNPTSDDPSRLPAFTDFSELNHGEDKTLPLKDCSCGIYGYWRAIANPAYHKAAAPLAPLRLPSVIIVKGKGKIIWGEIHQWRAQYVKPVAIALHDNVFDIYMRYELGEENLKPGMHCGFRAGFSGAVIAGAQWLERHKAAANYYDIPIVPYSFYKELAEIQKADTKPPKNKGE